MWVETDAEWSRTEHLIARVVDDLDVLRFWAEANAIQKNPRRQPQQMDRPAAIALNAAAKRKQEQASRRSEEAAMERVLARIAERRRGNGA